LRPRKSGDVLHVEERANYSLEAVKINAARALSGLTDARKRGCRCDEKKNHAIK
jgi:hypothetical protein